MKLKHALNIVSVLTVLAFGAISANAATTTLPFADGFESGFDGSGSGVWATNSSGDHIVSATAAAAISGGGAAGLLVSNATVTLDILDSTYANVWLQVYAKPVAGDDDPSVSSVSGAFYLKSDGTLRAYTGSWVQVQAGVPTGQYLGFTIHADYATDKWCLYYTSGPYATNQVLTTGGELEFAAAGTQIQTFSFESGDAAFFDGVAASPGFLSIGTCYANVQAVELSGAAVQSFELPVYPAHLTNGTSSRMSSSAGNAILTGMEAGDKVLFLTHANATGTADVYLQSGGAWIKDPGSSGSPAPADKDLLLSSRLQVDLSAATARWAFISYDTALSVDGEATGSASGYIETVTINGSDVNDGYTAIEWVEGETNPNSMGFSGSNPVGELERGSILYVQRANGTSWKTYWWDETADAWQDGANTATAPVPAGAHCWVSRSAAGGKTFTITH